MAVKYVLPVAYGSERWRIPIVADASLPLGYFEVRSGDRRVGCWYDRSNHDPGDEDRSER